jgi:diguanylate cyclase (GGDEF)-like protein
VLLILASLLPWSCHLAYRWGLSPYGLDIAPVGITLSGAVFAWAIFWSQLLDLVPVAHESVFASMSDGVLVLDRRDRLADYNPAAARCIAGLNRDAVGRGLKQALAAHPPLLRALEQARAPDPVSRLTSEEPSRECSVQGEDRVRRIEVRASPVLSVHGVRYGTIAQLVDVTEQVELRERLRELATLDALTRLPNRRHLIESAERELERALRHRRALSIVVLDLDHFKRINDRFGHQAGDAVLVEAAARLTRGTRSHDFSGRYGGEEFLMVLPETPPTQAALLAERLRSSFEAEPVSHQGWIIPLTASFGVSGLVEGERSTLDELVSQADQALYEAKHRGRNRVEVWAPGHERAVVGLSERSRNR